MSEEGYGRPFHIMAQKDYLLKARMLFSLLEPMGAFLVGFPEASERILEIEEMLAETGLLGDGTGG